MAEPEKFLLGRIVATPDALEALSEAGEEAFPYLDRHIHGDWGEVCEEDRRENELSLQQGMRLISDYTLKNGTTIWIITEAADEHGRRCATTFLLPQNY